MKTLLSALAISSCFAFSACATTDSSPPEALDPTSPEVVAGHRAMLQGFGEAYGYDVGYMQQLLELSPTSYSKFASAVTMSEAPTALPLDAYFVAQCSALLADDCGACTQLGLQMAVEAGVDRELLRTLMEEPENLPETLRWVQEHATQVARGENADADRVAALRKALGDDAFGELTTTILGSRLYPALRRALGAEVACPPPSLDF